MRELEPGFRDERLINLSKCAIERCQLDLSDAVVLTEAASGAYIVTPLLAAMAGSPQVLCIARPSKYGTVDEVAALLHRVARMAGVLDRIRICREKTPEIVGQADIVTNSGHVRPIDAQTVGWMKPSAVVPLMYESWEYRSADVDVDACLRRGVQVAGTNERHPLIDVFSYLGIMAVKLLIDAGIPVYGCKILLCCDNSFLPFIERGLVGAGAIVQVMNDLNDSPSTIEADAILIAMRPKDGPIVGPDQAALIAKRWPNAVVAQFWGDIDRRALAAVGMRDWPLWSPPRGHMGILPSAVGPDPIVRLQAGGLKVGEVLLKLRNDELSVDRSFLDEFLVTCNGDAPADAPQLLTCVNA
jgi:hypothetical protein